MIFLNGLFSPEVIRNSIPVPHVTYRGTGRQTYCNLHFHHHPPPSSFKEEVEGLLELVACDCILMREWLRRGDKAPGSGWEVLGGIRIIIKKRHVFKKHTMEQGCSCHPPLFCPFIPPSLHPSTLTPVGQLTFQCDGLLLAVECDIFSHHSLYWAKCAVLQIRGGEWENVKLGGSVDDIDVREWGGTVREGEREGDGER